MNVGYNTESMHGDTFIIFAEIIAIAIKSYI